MNVYRGGVYLGISLKSKVIAGIAGHNRAGKRSDGSGDFRAVHKLLHLHVFQVQRFSVIALGLVNSLSGSYDLVLLHVYKGVHFHKSRIVL